ncbi:DM13 domain-containing protein [Streptomyces sp. NPDC020681]|uniref:DM13 domain-containing protein n=1 Tax=Streptomyces sp. NPDC020681 TaxID=3365083 RepID=UPI0037978699
MRAILRRPVVIGLLVLGLVAAGFGALWFQPWKLWVDETVREELPAAAAPAAQDQGAAAAAPRTVAAGELISHEHRTTGSIKIVRLADGSHVLRLENLDTSNGPALRVLLADAPVKEGRAGWHVFDDKSHLSLGELKGNKGDQNYALPRDVDLSDYNSVSIWCDRFDVSFGAAELSRV